MFDEITCDYNLPGRIPDFVKPIGEVYQTKSFECTMTHYHIAQDGSLSITDHAGVTSQEDFTGVVNFYTSNSCGGWGEMTYTTKGEDFESVSYVATFVSGKLTKFECELYERGPALPATEMRFFGKQESKDKIAEDLKKEKKLRDESLIGKTMYVQYGGPSKGYPVKVVYEGPKQWCVQKKTKKGELELIDRWSRGHTFFKSKAEADKSIEADEQEYKDALSVWRKHVRAWKKKNKDRNFQAYI